MVISQYYNHVQKSIKIKLILYPKQRISYHNFDDNKGSHKKKIFFNCRAINCPKIKAAIKKIKKVKKIK